MRRPSSPIDWNVSSNVFSFLTRLVIKSSPEVFSAVANEASQRSTFGLIDTVEEPMRSFSNPPFPGIDLLFKLDGTSNTPRSHAQTTSVNSLTKASFQCRFLPLASGCCYWERKSEWLEYGIRGRICFRRDLRLRLYAQKILHHHAVPQKSITCRGSTPPSRDFFQQ